MGSKTIISILNRANRTLNDKVWARWSKDEMVDHYNDAVRAIILLRPDANAMEVSFDCSAGTKQSLPTNALRLIDVIRNSNGHVIRFTDRSVLDDSYPDWHATADATEVSAYTYDSRVPQVFFVYPGVVSGTKIDIAYSIAPVEKELADITSATAPATIDVNDVYANAILDYILYRCYSKDAEYSANSARAQNYLTSFRQQMGDDSATSAALAQAQTQSSNTTKAN